MSNYDRTPNMNSYEAQPYGHDAAMEARISEVQRAFLTKCFGWMTAGLALTGFVAYLTASSPEMLQLLFGNRWVFYAAIGVELALVLGLSWGINKLNATVATFLFMVYAAVSGLTFSVFLLVYTPQSIASVFFITAGMFGGVAVFGALTKRDLSGIGAMCGMALWGLIIAMVVNLFLGSDKMSWIISLVGVPVFVGLTAYDTQKLKQMAAEVDSDGQLRQKAAIMGALALYLDFVNLFLMLLKLLGSKK